MIKLENAVKEITTSTGVGSWILGGAVVNNSSFSSFLSDGDETLYRVSDGVNWEVGQGKYVALTNSIQSLSVESSSNSNNPVSFPAGTKEIWCVTTKNLLNSFSSRFPSMASLRSASLFLQGVVEVDSYYQGGAAGGGKWQSNPSDTTTGWYGVASCIGNTVTIVSTTNGSPYIGMQFNYSGSDGSRYITAGSGASWTISGTSLTLAAQSCTGDNGGSTIVALDGTRWNRTKMYGFINPSHYGATGSVLNGTVDNKYQLQSFINNETFGFFDQKYATSAAPTIPTTGIFLMSFRNGGIFNLNNSVANVGDCLLASQASNINLQGLWFGGYQNSWAVSFKTITAGSIKNCFCSNIMLAATDSYLSSGGYAAVTDASLCDDIEISGNSGVCTVTPAAQSQAFIHFMYAKNWSGNNNVADGYRECISWWGGDAGSASEGLVAANARKCYNGSLTGNRGVNLTGAGIWGSMGQNINVTGGYLHGASGSGEAMGSEGGIDVTFNAVVVRGAFTIGTYVNFLHQGKTQFIDCDIKIPGGTNAWLLFNESNTFFADLGDVVVKGGRYEAVGALAGFSAGICRQWIMEDVDIINAIPQEVSAQIGALFWDSVRVQTSYPPALPINSTWYVYVGGFSTGFTVQPASKGMIRGLRVEQIGTKVAGGRGLGLSTGAANVDIEVVDFEFVNIDQDITFENTGGGNVTTTVHDGVCNSSASYPAVSYNTANHTVVWQNVRNELGQDAYGSSTAANLSSVYLATLSRIWNNTPGIGKPSYWEAKAANTWQGQGYPDGSTTVSGLPAAASSTEGATAVVTDATATTFLSTVAGGGTNHVPVKVINGNWLIA